MNKNIWKTKKKGEATGRCLNQFERKCLRVVLDSAALLALGLACYGLGFLVFGAIYTVVNMIGDHYLHHDLIPAPVVFWVCGIAFVWNFASLVRGKSEVWNCIRQSIDAFLEGKEEEKYDAALGNLWSASLLYGSSPDDDDEVKLRKCVQAVHSIAVARWGEDWKQVDKDKLDNEDRELLQRIEWNLGEAEKLEKALVIYRRPDLASQVKKQEEALARLLRAVQMEGHDLMIKGECPLQTLLDRKAECEARRIIKSASSGICLGSSNLFLSVKSITQGDLAAKLTVTVALESGYSESPAIGSFREQIAQLIQRYGLAPEPTVLTATQEPARKYSGWNYGRR